MTTHNKLDQAIQAMQAETHGQKVPAEVLQKTLAGLNEQVDLYSMQEQPSSLMEAFGAHRADHWRWAVAAILLLLLGFAAGQITVRGTIDRQMEQMQGRMERLMARQQQHLLQVQQANLMTAARHLDQGLDQRLNRFALDLMAASQASQQQWLAAVSQSVSRKQTQQQKQLVQLLGQLESQQKYQNAILADSLFMVADMTQEGLEYLLYPEQQTDLMSSPKWQNTNLPNQE